MTNISKNKLSAKVEAELWNQFCTITTKLTRNDSSLVFSELLGKEEQIMLAKRLAVIFMCIEGYTSYKITKLLKISPSTAHIIAMRYRKGDYDNLEATLTTNKKNYQETWKLLGKILRGGLPAIEDPHRWSKVLQK